MLGVDSAGDFARKKPKPPYVFRHPSQGNRRGDLARRRKIDETTPQSKVREPKQRVRALSRSGGVSQPKSFQAVWFPSVGRKWAVRQYRFLLPGSSRSAPGGGRFGRNWSSTCAAKSKVWRNGLQGGRGIRYGTGRNRPNRLVGEATKGRIPGLMATYRDDGCRSKVLVS